jgi:hypothetical protein
MNASVADVYAPTMDRLRVGHQKADTFLLQLTGHYPLRFSGRRIGFGTSKRHSSSDWKNVTLYKTEDGTYVADVEHWFAFPKLSKVTEAVTAANATELLKALEESDGTLDPAVQGACASALRNDPLFMMGSSQFVA